MGEIQLLGHTNYRPTFCTMDTWTLHTGYGLQAHLTGNGLLLRTQTGYKLDTWTTRPIANMSDEKNKKGQTEIAQTFTACKAYCCPQDCHKLRK